MAPSKKPPRTPADPWLRLLAYGLDGTEPQDVVLDFLTVGADPREATMARTALLKHITNAGVRRRVLIKTLSTIVRRMLHVRGETATMAAAKAQEEWRALATQPQTIRLLRWLATEQWDDVFWEHAGPSLRLVADRLEALRRDPTRWVSLPSTRRTAGNPFITKVVPWARQRLARDAAVKDPALQTEFLRLLGLPVPKPR